MNTAYKSIDAEMLERFHTFLALAQDLLSRIHNDQKLHRELRSKDLQSFWETVQMLSLFGMNAVSGGHLPESGEEVTLKLLNAAFPGESVRVLDVGANFGDYSALILETLGSRAKVWAFEPLPANYEALSNRFAAIPEVTTLNLAVGRAVGELPFFVDAEISTIGSLIPRKLEHEGVSLIPQVSVPVVTLDAWVASQGIQHVHLLKIDVEGADLDVLIGARELINDGRISLIQFEFSAAQIDARHYFKDFFGLLSPKYALYRIVGDGLIEIQSYVERYEIFSCINYLAVLRTGLP